MNFTPLFTTSKVVVAVYRTLSTTVLLYYLMTRMKEGRPPRDRLQMRMPQEDGLHCIEQTFTGADTFQGSNLGECFIIVEHQSLDSLQQQHAPWAADQRHLGDAGQHVFT